MARKSVGFSLILALMLPMIIFGQTARPGSNDSSLADSGSLAPIKGEKTEQIIETPGDPEAAPEGSPCGWTAAPVSPIPILDQGTVTVGSNLYTFAGVSTAIIATANKFDGTTWTTVAPVPAALEYPTVVSSGTAAYIMGGANTTGASVNTLYRYNPATNDYTTLAPSAAGTSTWNAAGAYLNGKIYKIGGYHSEAGATTGLATVEIYDIATNTWSLGAPYPQAAGWISAFVQGNFLYAAGGLDTAVGAVPLTKTYRYDPATNMWDDAAIADMPISRWGAASSQTAVDGGWVIAGGYAGGTAAANLTNTAIKWDPVTNTWSNLPNMLQARARMTGSVLNGAFHVIGGRSSAGGFAGTNDNQRLFCIPATQPFIQGAVTYVSDNGTPANNVPDPGETVTVSLDLHNVGGGATSTVTATLASTGGITNPSGAQNFGTIAPGATVSRNFTFQVPAGAACGSQITLTFDVVDGSTHYTVTKTYTLGVQVTTLTQNFDAVTIPALPAGWTSVQTSGTAINWTTVNSPSNSAPNSAFAPDVAGVNASALVSPAFNVTVANATVTFKNSYNTESGFDGMVLEISTDGGTTWQDIVAAGGSFTSGGYNSTISTSFMSPIGGRMAWSGNSGGFVTTTANLPASANGQSVRLRWLMATDSSVAATGANIDDVVVAAGYTCSTVGGPTVRSRADFDGDGKTDLSVFRPSEGNWYLNQSTAGFGAFGWGLSGDVLTPGDYDGDGKTDAAIFRATADPSQPDFYVLNSMGFTVAGVSWGVAGDIPVTADYDGDGKTDAAVYRPSDHTWYILKSGGGITVTAFGQAGDVPVAGDFDGDGKGDLTVYRAGTWITQRSTGGTATNALGSAGDVLVPADYDGDNKDDVAVFRPSTGQWFILRSSGGGVQISTWGASGDVPVPGDYDGDGKDDLAIYRNGQWWINASTSGVIVRTFGVASDRPIPKAYLP